MKTVHVFALLVLVSWRGFGGSIACAQPTSPDPQDAVVKAGLRWSADAAKPGDRITLAVVLEIKSPYHVNSNKAKEGFIPTTVELVNIPPGIQASTPVFPAAHEVDFGVGANKEKLPVFSGRTTVYITMAVMGSAQPGDRPVEVKVGYQACDDKNCLFPTSVTEKTNLRVVPSSARTESTNPELFAGLKQNQEKLSIAFFGWDFTIEPSRLWLLLLVAAIGGALLNFTPCVLPLIPIKIIGLSRAAGNRQRCFLLGLALSAGVVGFWLALAAAISTISGFDATNKLFQYPGFTIGVGVVICVMAFGMCGLFAVTLPQSVYRVNPSQESLGGSFVFGIMTAVLSTPCTAPFMGAAAAWSATQRPLITITTFAAIGLGMALPYLVLSAFPVLVNRMPRTGPASELIKQVMGLLLFAAGAYFLGTGLAGVLSKPPDPPTDAYWYLVALFIAVAGLWLAWRTIQLTPVFGKRLVFGGLGLLLVLTAVGVGSIFTRSSPIEWIYYTPERLADAQRQKKVVVVEFTAAWCLNCHALEKAVLHNEAIVRLLNSKDVAPIKVDLTGNNTVGNQKLIDVGRVTIPYLVVYGTDGKVIFSSDAYTVEQLTEALQSAGVKPETKTAKK
jgi:thiol:disulfide interchange protein